MDERENITANATNEIAARYDAYKLLFFGQRPSCDACIDLNIRCNTKHPCYFCKKNGQPCTYLKENHKSAPDSSIHIYLDVPTEKILANIQHITGKCCKCETQYSNIWMVTITGRIYCHLCYLQKVKCIGPKSTDPYDLFALKKVNYRFRAHCAKCFAALPTNAPVPSDTLLILCPSCQISFDTSILSDEEKHFPHFPLDPESKAIQFRYQNAISYVPNDSKRPTKYWNDYTEDEKAKFINSHSLWEFAEVTSMFNLFPTMPNRSVDWITPSIEYLSKQHHQILIKAVELLKDAFLGKSVKGGIDLLSNKILHESTVSIRDEIILQVLNVIVVRLSIGSSRWIENLKSLIVINKGLLDRCIGLYYSSEWENKMLYDIFALCYDWTQKIHWFSEACGVKLSYNVHIHPLSPYTALYDDAYPLYGMNKLTRSVIIEYWKLINNEKGSTSEQLDQIRKKLPEIDFNDSDDQYQSQRKLMQIGLSCIIEQPNEGNVARFAKLLTFKCCWTNSGVEWAWIVYTLLQRAKTMKFNNAIKCFEQVLGDGIKSAPMIGLCIKQLKGDV